MDVTPASHACRNVPSARSAISALIPARPSRRKRPPEDRMFAPSRDEARRFFVDAWAKYRAGAALEGIESTAVALIALHPEYHTLLEDPARHLERDYVPE